MKKKSIISYVFIVFLQTINVFAFTIVPDTTKPRIPAIPKRELQQKDSLRTFQSAKQVVITGTRNEVLLRDSPVRVEVIDKKNIASTAMVNVGDLLREQTGMLLTNNVRTGVQMMGLGADYTQILIDGQPMIGRVAGVLDLSRISVGNIERVEVVKGPMSSLYGSEALAGVINIISKKPSMGLSGSMFGQYINKGPAEFRGELQYGSENLDVSGFLNVKKASAFTLIQDSISIPYQGFSDITFQGKALWFVKSGIKLGADIRYFSSESNGKFIESFFGQIASNQGSVFQQDGSITVSGEWTHGKARLLTQLYGASYHERYTFDSAQGAVGTNDDLTRQLFRSYTQYDVFWSAKNRYTFGVEYTVDDIGGTRYPDNPFFGTLSGFMQWEGNPASWISYALSARYVKNSAYENPGIDGNDFLQDIAYSSNPKLAVNVKVNDGIRFHTSIGTGFKVPDFRQLYVQFSNRLGGAGYDLIGARRLGLDLQPERSVSYDIGGIVDQWDISAFSSALPMIGTFECRLFYNHLSNLIEFYFVGSNPQTNQAIYSYRNISRAMTQGLETSVRMMQSLDQRSNKTLTISMGYQFLDTRDVEVFDAIEQGMAGTINPLTGSFVRLTSSQYGGLWFRSAHSGTLSLRYEDRELGLSASLRAQFIGRFGDEALDVNGPVYKNRKVLDEESEYVSGYSVVNMGLGYTLSLTGSEITNDELLKSVTGSQLPNMRIQCGVNNVFNTMNIRSLPNLLGRQLFMSIQIAY